MHFETPAHVRRVEIDFPDTLPIHDFLFSEDSQYGRRPKAASKAPFTCGITGKAYSLAQVEERVEHLARALSSEIDCQVNEGDEMDKVIGIFSLNTIDVMTVSWAVHRLSGVSCPISALYTTEQLAQQLRATRCKALFTSAPLFDVALNAAVGAGIPRNHVYVLEVPEMATKGMVPPSDLKTVDDLIALGAGMTPLPSIEWALGQGARQTAFLCASSGTSGLPKIVKVTHRNVIASVLQGNAFENAMEDKQPEVVLAVLPQSHILCLVPICHMSVHRGDGVVILPGFDIMATLGAIHKFRINRLWLIPPMVMGMTSAASLVKTFDLSCITSVAVGAAALSKEASEQFLKVAPACDLFFQGYGLTETSGITFATHKDDVLLGSCGWILPNMQARLIGEDGNDIDDYSRPGELLLRGPNIVSEYYGNPTATAELLTTDGWMRTGDLVEVRKSDAGHSHLFVVDRVKELIKVNGMQVAPAELEAYLRRNPIVADVSVVPIPNQFTGELPRAYIVRSPASKNQNDGELEKQLHDYVNEKFAQYKRLAGGIEFIDSIPKSASGKPQRALLKQMAKAVYEANQNVLKFREKLQQHPVQVFDFPSDDDEDDDVVDMPQPNGKTKTKTSLEIISHGGPTLAGPPAFPDFSVERKFRLEHLAATFRHWSRQNYVFGLSGHISYRDPEYPDAFWTNPLGLHFGLLRVSDMVLVNLAGEVIGGNRSRPANTAGFFIHAAVHKIRPDVHAACHCHTPAGKAWSAIGRRLDMLTQDACKFYRDAHAVYDSYGGVVLAEEEGIHIAKTLGPEGKGCILKNHGLLTVGQTVDEAAWLFDAMEHACRDQLAVEAAVANGNLTKALISDEQARAAFDLEADPSYCYAEFQVYYDYEDRMSQGEFKL